MVVGDDASPNGGRNRRKKSEWEDVVIRTARARLGILETEADPPDYIPYYPIGIVRACALAYHDHGILPVAGGFLDQPEQLWMDMMAFLNEMNDVIEVLKPDVQAGPDYDAEDPRTWFKGGDGDEARLGLW